MLRSLRTCVSWREVAELPQSVAGGECRFLAVSWEKLFLITELSRPRGQHCGAIKGEAASPEGTVLPVKAKQELRQDGNRNYL